MGCKYFDKENGWCANFSDWSGPMPMMCDCTNPNGCKFYEEEAAEETADEMFRALGYKREVGDIPFPCYKNECGIYIDVCPTNSGCAKYETISGYGPRYLPLDRKEVKAIEKLLDEMGWSDD